MMKDLKTISIKIFESLNKKKDAKTFSGNIKFRRSLYAKKNIKINEKITHQNIIALRPKIGICASQYFKIIGKKIKKNIEANEPIYKNYIL